MKFRSLTRKAITVILTVAVLISQESMLISEAFAEPSSEETTESTDTTEPGAPETQEAGTPDTTETDAANQDTANPDAANTDAGSQDATNIDAGSPNAADAGSPDTTDTGEGTGEGDQVEKPVRTEEENAPQMVADPANDKQNTKDNEGQDGSADPALNKKNDLETTDPEIVVSENSLEVPEDYYEDGEMVVGGYIDMPWDYDTPVVDDGMGYTDAIDDIVDEGGPERSRYVSDPGSVQAKFPDYDSEDDILSYLKDTYPATRSQSPYGTCWAHSAMALSEFYLIKHRLEDQEGAAVDKDVNYSELQMAYFCYNQAPNPVMGDTGDSVTYEKANKSFLDYGGNLDFAAQSLMRYNGVTTDTNDAEYSNAESVLSNGLADEYASSKDVVHLKNEYQINIKQNPNLVKQAIIENGIAGISFYADRAYINESTNAYYNNYNTHTNHAVAIVGWDDNYPVTNFQSGRRPDAPGAWLIRNSWTTNTRFSYYSYFWLSYEDTSLADTAYVFDMASPDEFYTNNYYYDSELHNVQKAPSNKTANIFMVQGSGRTAQETLGAVQLDSTMNANISYMIQIYRHLRNASDPTSGTEITEAKTEGTLPFAGKYTIPLNSSVTLERDEIISIVVTTTGGVLDQECSYDWTDGGGNSVKMSTVANQGESFYYSGNRWYDVSTRYNGNVCIRALSKDVGGSFPDYISDLSVRNRTESNVTLAWSQANEAEGYEIWYSEAENGTYTKVETTTSNVRRYTHSGLAAGVTYFYKVYPVKNGEKYDAGVSPVISVTTLSATPELEITYIGNYTAKVRWNELSNCDGYEIEYGKGNVHFNPITLSKTVNEYRLQQLNPNDEYYVKIRAFSTDSGGNRSYGNYCERTFTTANGTGTAVTNLRANPWSTGVIELSWDRMEEAWAYNVEQSTDGVNYTLVKQRITNNYTYFQNLSVNTKYYFKVTAIYLTFDDQDTFTSEPVSSYTKLQPSTITATVNEAKDGINLTWTAVTGANYYSIYKRGNGDDDFNPLVIVSATGQLKYEDRSVLPGRRYYYTVYGCRTNELTNMQGASSNWYSNVIPLGEVNNLTPSDVTSGTAVLSWDAVNGADGYEISACHRANNSWTEWEEIDTVNADQLSYTMSGLLSNTRYAITVCAFTDDCYGSWSENQYFNTLELDGPTEDMFTVSVSDATYDGTRHAATATSTDAGINSAGITVSYAKVTNGSIGSYSTTAPKDVGTYQVQIKTEATESYSAATLTDTSWRFTISPREVRVSGITASNKTYDGTTTATIDCLSAVFTGEIDGDILTVTATGSFADKNAGTGKTVNISIETLGGNSAGNYRLAASGQQQTTTTANISAKSLRVSANAKSKTYGAADPSLTYTVNSSDLATGDTTATVMNGSLSRAAGETVGTYAISQGTLSAGSNYTISFTGANLTITAKTVTNPVIVLSSTSFTYSGSPCEPSVTVKDGTTVIPEDEYTVEYSNNTNYGTATVTIKDRTGGNYTVSGSKTFAIAKAPSSVSTTPAARNLTYTGASQQLITEGAASGGTIEYKLGTGGTYSENIPSAVNAGNYTVYYKVVGDDNHSDTAEDSVSVTINKAAYGDKTASGSAKYGNSGETDLSRLIASGGSITTGPLLISDENSVISGTPYIQGNKLKFSFVNDDSKKDKTATVTVGVNGGTNYENYSITTTLTVLDKYPQVLAFNGVNGDSVIKDYGSADFTYKATLTQGNGTISYSSSDPTIATVDAQGKVHIQKKTGETVIMATAAATDDYTAGSASYTLTVNKRKITVTGIAANGKTYDRNTTATLNFNNALLSGKMQGDAISISANGVFEDANAGTNKTVNITGLTLTGDDAGLYELAGTGQQRTATATISPRTVTLSWTNTSFTYDGTTKTPTATAGGLIGSDSCSVTVSGGKADAGTYTATASGLTGASASNYTLPSVKTTSFTIAPADSSITRAPVGKTGLVYNGSAKDLITTGTASGGTMQYALGNENAPTQSFSGTAPKATNAGTYWIYYKVVGDRNHRNIDTVSKISATIGKASAPATQPSASISTPYSNTRVSMVSLPTGWTWAAADAGKSLAVGVPTTAEARYTASDKNNYTDAGITKVVTITRQDAVRVTGVTLNRTSGSINIGATLSLTATVSPSNAQDKSVTWRSSNTKIATVTSSGVVRGISAGTANITVTTTDGGKTATCRVTVINPTVATTGVTISKTSATLTAGQGTTLTATVKPSNATNKTVVWTSSNPAVATVNASGYVKAVKRGKAVITVRTASGGKTATCTVTVNPSDKVEAFVVRLYRVVLEREPDEGGLAYWVAELKSGRRTGADVVGSFYLSDEMKNRGLSNSKFVDLAYNGIQGRSPDPNGKTYWADALDSGTSYNFVVCGFIGSEEFTNLCSQYGIKRGSVEVTEARDKNLGVTKFVSRLYTKVHERPYDAGGLNYWCGDILNNPSRENVIRVAKFFFNSDEFVSRNHSNGEYVKILYNAMHGREYDQGGYYFWVGKLNSGEMSRDQVLEAFAYSDEFSSIMASYGL